MSPSETVRAMLDKLDVKYEDYDILVGEKAYGATTYWECGDVVAKFSEKVGVGTLLEAWDVTPEQAIAATVGEEPDEATMLKLHGRMNAALLDTQDELLAYHPQDRENASSKKLIDCVIAAHQIIEDAATEGRPKVKKVRGMTYDEHGGEVYYLACSGCGEWIDGDLDCISEFDGPNFCPNCGGEFDGPLLCKRCGGLADSEYGDMCVECYEEESE